jgi:hypothetical protein
MCLVTVYISHNSTKSPYSGEGKVRDVTSRESARTRVRIGQCVSAVRDVKMPVLLSLSCVHTMLLYVSWQGQPDTKPVGSVENS